MPFSNAPMLTQNIFDITGMKLFNVLMLLLLILWKLKRDQLVYYYNSLEKKVISCLLIYLLVFSLEFFRSLYNFDILSSRFISEFPESPLKYILSYWVKSILYVAPLLYILQFIKQPQYIKGVVSVLLLSFIIFDIVAISISYNVSSYGLERSGLRLAFTETLGIHYNNAATIIMTGIPITLGLFYKYGWRYLIIFIFMMVALFLAESRGAVLGAAVGILFVMYMNKKIALNLVIGITGFLAILYFTSDSLIALFYAGINDNDMYKITSGRVEAIWIPLLVELLSDSQKLLFGMGLLGVIQSDSYAYAYLFYQNTTTAHNAYINLLVDSGLVILIPFIIMIVSGLWKAIKIKVLVDDQVYYGLLGSIVAYLIASVSGRQFFPALDNILLFPIIALIIAYLQLEHVRGDSPIDTKRG